MDGSSGKNLPPETPQEMLHEYNPILFRWSFILYVIAHWIQVGTYYPIGNPIQAKVAELLQNPTYLTSLPAIIFYTEMLKGILESEKVISVIKSNKISEKLNVLGIVEGARPWAPEIITTVFLLREIQQELVNFGYDDSFVADVILGLIAYAIERGYSWHRSKERPDDEQEI